MIERKLKEEIPRDLYWGDNMIGEQYAGGILNLSGSNFAEEGESRVLDNNIGKQFAGEINNNSFGRRVLDNNIGKQFAGEINNNSFGRRVLDNNIGK